MAPEAGPEVGPDEPSDPTVVALDQIVPEGDAGNGVHWALDDNPDLNVNLAHLDGGQAIASHVNASVEVAVVVLHGEGVALVDGREHDLSPHTLVVIPCGAERALRAADAGLTYLTVHRRRGPMTIGRPDPAHAAETGGDAPCWAHDHEDY